MVNPYVIVAISTVTILAFAAILSVSGDQLEYSKIAQDTFDIKNDRISEDLKLTINDDGSIKIKNNAANPVRIKEIRVLNDINNDHSIISKLDYALKRPEDNGLRLAAFNQDTIDKSELGISDYDGKQIIAITELGNVFTAEFNKKDSKNNASGNGGLGIFGNGGTFRIVELSGQIIHGQGVTGKEESVKPYTNVDASSEFAALILDDDKIIQQPVPEFGEKYVYKSGNLQMIKTPKKNILGFSQSKTIEGSGVATNGDKIIFSGSGKIITKLNNIAGQDVFLRGEMNSGSIKLVESPYDLITTPYVDGKGYKVCEEPESSTAYGSWHRHGRGRGSWGHYHYASAGFSFNINCQVGTESTHTIIYDYTRTWGSPKCGGRGTGCYDFRGGGSYSSSATLDIGKQTSDDGYLRISQTAGSGSHGSYSGTVAVYDTLPVKNMLTFTSNFEQVYKMPPSGTLYLVAESDGGSISMKAEFFNPNEEIFLEISGLPPNIPYKIEKNGLVGARGIASNTGKVALTADNLSFNSETSPGGILKIYPDSIKYKGSFSTVVLDTLNEEVIHLDDGHKRVYSPFAYVRVPLSVDTAIKNVLVGSVSLPYFDGDYKVGDALNIPILPGTDAITIDVNGMSNVMIRLRDLPDITGGKPIPPETATNSKYSTSGALADISADAGSAAIAVATDSGKMYAMVTMSVSGDSSFSNDVSFYFVPDPPPPPPSRDPLSVYVDVYKNGELIKSEMIYYDDKPDFTPIDSFNGLALLQATNYNYNQRTASAMVLVDVQAGDLVEFYARAHIHAEGIPLNIPNVQGGQLVIDRVVSAASATAKIHSGSILTGAA